MVATGGRCDFCDRAEVGGITLDCHTRERYREECEEEAISE